MNKTFVLAEAELMVPLVRQILQDIVAYFSSVEHLRRRLAILDDCRSSSNFAVRRQCHLAEREVRHAEEQLRAAESELENLDVQLLDPVRGVVGFPFLWSPKPSSRRVRNALFLLRLADRPERGIRAWRFVGESKERRIPSHWTEEFSLPPLDEVGMTPEQ